MEVLFKKTVSGRGFTYSGGKVYDLPTPEAEYWIKEGKAQVHKEPVQKPLITPKVKATRQPVKPKR